MLKQRKTLRGLLFSFICVVPFGAHAESEIDVGTAATSRSAAARVDFRIIIPEFLYFRVGSVGAIIDRIDFDLSAIANPETAIGGGTPQTATAGGDAGVGIVSARVISNAGQITITEDTGGGLATGGGSTISFSEIVTASSDANLPAPTLSDTGAGGNTALPVLNTSRVTNRAANWTYTYANTALPDAGQYDGRVTYVASSP